jgi:hypothetical protein
MLGVLNNFQKAQSQACAVGVPGASRDSQFVLPVCRSQLLDWERGHQGVPIEGGQITENLRYYRYAPPYALRDYKLYE